MANAWWPPLETLQQAQSASRQGVWAAGLVAAVTAIVATVALVSRSPVAGIDAWAYLDAVLFVAAAFGIYKLSRLAAVGGLVLYVLESLYMLVEMRGPGAGIVVRLVITLAFVNSVRGTFAYHRLLATTPPTVTPTPPAAP